MPCDRGMDFIDREQAKRHAKEQVTQAGPAAPDLALHAVCICLSVSATGGVPATRRSVLVECAVCVLLAM